MPTHRQTRVARRLKEEIARILLREVDDPLVRLVTITDVAVAPDLKHARVFFSVVGEAGDDPSGALRGLRRARRFIQRRLAEDAELRFTPTLSFRFDPTAGQAQRVEAILRQISAEGGLDREDDADEAKPDDWESNEHTNAEPTD